MLEKIPECILNMNFMNFDENSNLELDLKIKKIIFRVNLEIFQGHEKIPECTLIMIFDPKRQIWISKSKI